MAKFLAANTLFDFLSNQLDSRIMKHIDILCSTVCGVSSTTINSPWNVWADAEFNA